MLKIHASFDHATGTVSYLIWDAKTKSSAIIDPVLAYDNAGSILSSFPIDCLLNKANTLQLDIKWVLETHVHADHLSASKYVQRKTGAQIGISNRITEVQKHFKPIFAAYDVSETGAEFDHLFSDGENLPLGELKLTVLHTPGHTPACASYLIEDAIFVGDTIFMPDYGSARCDFPGGSATTLYHSIQKILSLPPETRLFVGHDYPPLPRTTPKWETRVAEQKTSNIHINENVTEKEFVTRRTARDAMLSTPKLLLPSLQVNIRAGDLPPAEEDGTQFLRLPISPIN